jgi:hypothetical protein
MRLWLTESQESLYTRGYNRTYSSASEHAGERTEGRRKRHRHTKTAIHRAAPCHCG